MAIKRILFPTKFRKLAFNSLEALFVLKKAGLKEVVLCHVIPRDEVAFVPFGGYLKEEEEKLREEARIRFEDWQKSLSDKGIESRIVTVVGEPVPQILAIAEEENVDLVVVGKKKRVGIEKSFIGSHTLEIISRSKVPTLVSKYMVQFKWNDATLTKMNERFFETPMLVTDWTGPSERALDLLISLNGIIKKALVFHDIKLKDKDDAAVDEKECKKKLENCCKKLESAGIKAESHVGAGDVLEEILRVSRERKASMIIIGTTCKDRLHEMFQGSTSHKVTRISELPTLLVP